MARDGWTNGRLWRLVLTWAPKPEYLLNHWVNRIPLVRLRMRAYQIFGVRFEDFGTTTIMLGTEVWSPRRLRLGAGTVVGRWCLLDARGGLTIGRNVNVSSYTRFMTAKHMVDSLEFAAQLDEIHVGDRAWIAMGATVLGGAHIGSGAVVAAGAVVTKPVEAFTIVGGVPAAEIGRRPENLEYMLTYRPNWI
jgi:hypothetical protein